MIVQFALNLLTAAVGVGLALAAGQFLLVVYTHQKTFARFRRQCKGIPFVEAPRFYDGHMRRYACRPRNWTYQVEDHKKYGKHFAFMLGPDPAVSTCDIELIKRVAIDEAELHTDHLSYGVMPVKEFILDNIVLAGGDQWRRLRRHLAPAFTSHRIKAPNVQEEMRGCVDKFVEAIEARIRYEESVNKRGATTMDLEDWTWRYILDLVFTCFYKQSSQVDYYSKHDFWQRLMDKSTAAMTHPVMELPFVFPLFRVTIEFLLDNFHLQGVLRRALMGFIKEQTKSNLEARRKIQASGGREDGEKMILDDGIKFKRNLIDAIIDKFHDGHLTEREYLHSSFSLFLAANKTTTDGISKALYLIAKHPRVQERLRQATAREGVESEYLAWCINEALRLYPPAPIGASRKLATDVRTQDGQLIPRGTLIVNCLHLIHRLPVWGEAPDEFRPERWANARGFHPAQFLSFGAGKRKCIGKEFALHGIKLAIVKLLELYKLEYVSGSNDAMMFAAPFQIFCHYEGPTNVRFTKIRGSSLDDRSD